MDLLIIVKWLTDYSQPSFIPEQSQLRAPSIISTMIVMVLGLGEQKDPKMKERDLIENQTAIMRILLVIVLICAPVMLLVKPLHARAQMQKEEKVTHHEEKMYVAINDDQDEDEP